VYKTLLCGICVLGLASSGLAAQTSSGGASSAARSAGVVIPRQVCADNPDETYALYLPSGYNPHQRWPIIYAFDPDGRGEVPVQLMKVAAERYGYIVVGSNNSRNGSGKEEGEAAQAMWNDTHSRFTLDDRQIYFAGFSGGARVASLLAQQCKCAAGVLLDGAGLATNQTPADVKFAVFAAVGQYDFNYPELANLDEKLGQTATPHFFRTFDGPHEWAPADVMDEALAWFRVIAMKENRAFRGADFIAAQKADFAARAQALQQSGHAYQAWREYQQTIATFDGLTDTASLQQTAASLAQQKAVREGPKREQQEFKDQQQITGQIYGSFIALRSGSGSGGVSLPALPGEAREQAESGGATTLMGGNTANHPDIVSATQQKIINLRESAASERNPEKLLVDRRALGGVLVGAGEFGDQALAAKNYSLAKEYYLLATDAGPDSVGALKDLATARALDNDHKGTIDALRRAKQKAKDPAAFTAWLNHEPAFAKLHDDAQFRALLANPE